MAYLHRENVDWEIIWQKLTRYVARSLSISSVLSLQIERVNAVSDDPTLSISHALSLSSLIDEKALRNGRRKGRGRMRHTYYRVWAPESILRRDTPIPHYRTSRDPIEALGDCTTEISGVSIQIEQVGPKEGGLRKSARWASSSSGTFHSEKYESAIHFPLGQPISLAVADAYHAVQFRHLSRYVHYGWLVWNEFNALHSTNASSTVKNELTWATLREGIRLCMLFQISIQVPWIHSWRQHIDLYFEFFRAECPME